MACAASSPSMRSCAAPEAWVTRAQPWLGTLVEIALPPADATEPRFAAGFAAIAHVHRKMSPQEASSDLASIAGDAHVRPVRIDPDTYAVLELARALWQESGGLFDVTVAPAGRMAALHLEGACRVGTDEPLALDLGGIAKGYAVDRAVDALKAAGALSGRVNAGGDLRAFGTKDWTPVHVRHPADPSRVVALFEMGDAAVATSADYFRDDPDVLFDPRSGRARAYGGSITVVAPTCAQADALVKVIALDEARTPLLERHGAQAFRLPAR